jgi:hypothetical protein
MVFGATVSGLAVPLRVLSLDNHVNYIRRQRGFIAELVVYEVFIPMMINVFKE